MYPRKNALKRVSISRICALHWSETETYTIYQNDIQGIYTWMICYIRTLYWSLGMYKSYHDIQTCQYIRIGYWELVSGQRALTIITIYYSYNRQIYMAWHIYLTSGHGMLYQNNIYVCAWRMIYQRLVSGRGAWQSDDHNNGTGAAYTDWPNGGK